MNNTASRILDAAGRPIFEGVTSPYERFVDMVKTEPGKVRRLLVELDMRTRSLYKKDKGTWRSAHQAAIDVENPRRSRLYDIYDDAQLDTHLTGCQEQITNAIAARKMKVMDIRTQTESPELTEIFETEWFDELVGYMLEAFAYGHSLVELGDVVDVAGKRSLSGVTLIPRRHVCPEFGVILKDANDTPDMGIPYRDDQKLYNQLIECGGPRSLGYLLKVSPHYLSKKNMEAFWDTFGETFGIPIRIAKTTSKDTADREDLFDMLNRMGAAATGVFPEGTEIEIKEATHTDAYNVFDRRIERANAEISKCVINQTMTIESGASLSQSQVHLDIFNRCVQSRAHSIVSMVNGKLIPRLRLMGFPFSENHRLVWDDKVQYSPQEQLNIEQALLQYYDIDPEYFEQKYGISITGIRTGAGMLPVIATGGKGAAAEKKKIVLWPSSRTRS